MPVIPRISSAEAAALRERAHQVEAMRGGRGVRQQPQRQAEGNEADRHVDREQPWPRRDCEDRRSDGRAGGRRYRHRHRGHRNAAAQLPARIGETHQRDVDARHASGAEALQRATQRQHRQRVRQRADECREAKHCKTDHVDAAIAEDVAERSQRQQRYDDGELISVDDPAGLAPISRAIVGSAMLAIELSSTDTTRPVTSVRIAQ